MGEEEAVEDDGEEEISVEESVVSSLDLSL